MRFGSMYMRVKAKDAAEVYLLEASEKVRI